MPSLFVSFNIYVDRLPAFQLAADQQVHHELKGVEGYASSTDQQA